VRFSTALIFIFHLISDAHAERSHLTVCSVQASVPDPYAQGTHQFLMRMLSIFLLKLKKSLLTIRLSIRVRIFAAPNEPLNIFIQIFYFNPIVALP
jgi:hypothetical protein